MATTNTGAMQTVGGQVGKRFKQIRRGKKCSRRKFRERHRRPYGKKCQKPQADKMSFS
jgi:hypothetical protein